MQPLDRLTTRTSHKALAEWRQLPAFCHRTSVVPYTPPVIHENDHE